MNKNKLNLHTHSPYSDGTSTMEELANATRELGFTALVVTDHVYWKDHQVSNSAEKFKEQKMEAYILSHKLNYPIIVGAEFMVNEGEEFLIFGWQAIVNLLYQREKWLIANHYEHKMQPLVFDDIKRIRNQYHCAVILCHPELKKDFQSNEIEFFQKGGLDFIDGYEHYNSGINMFRYPEKQMWIKNFENHTAFSNSDAHKVSHLDSAYNFFDEEITTELQLIEYIRNRKPVEMYAYDKKVDKT